MQKIILLFGLLLSTVLFADAVRTETSYSVSYTVMGNTFEEVQLQINNELQVNGFNVVYEINIAKAMAAVSESQEKQPPIAKGISMGFCKPSTSYKLLEKNPDTLLYCPFRILIVEKEEGAGVVVSFLKAPRLNDAIDPKELDATIDTIIASALN